MLIRNAEEKDIEQITKLGKNLLTLHTEFDGIYYELEDSFHDLFVSWVREQIINPTKSIIVAYENEKVVGFISGYLKSLYPWFKTKTVGHISFLYVLPEYRRRKVGKLLNEQSLNWFRSNNIKYVEVFADEKNSVAINAWGSYGFGAFKKFFRKSLCL